MLFWTFQKKWFCCMQPPAESWYNDDSSQRFFHGRVFSSVKLAPHLSIISKKKIGRWILLGICFFLFFLCCKIELWWGKAEKYYLLLYLYVLLILWVIIVSQSIFLLLPSSASVSPFAFRNRASVWDIHDTHGCVWNVSCL